MSAPAGWYPDPSAPGRLRWWDGSTWTEHTHGESRPASAQAPAPWQRAQPHPEQVGWGAKALPDAGGRSGQAAATGRATTTPDGQPLAPLGLRLLARILDGIVVSALSAVAGFGYLRRLYVLAVEGVPTGSQAPADPLAAATELLAAPEVQTLQAQFALVLVVVTAVYTVPMLRYFGGTPGKLLCGIRVRAWDRPGLPTWGEAVRRWLLSDLLGNLSQLGALYQVVDYAWPLWDRRKQALHDKWARTVVVRR